MTARNKKRAFAGLGKPQPKPAEKSEPSEAQVRAIEAAVEAKGAAVPGRTEGSERPKETLEERGSRYYKRKGRITKEGRRGGGDVLRKMTLLVPQPLAQRLQVHCARNDISLSEGVSRALDTYLGSED